MTIGIMQPYLFPYLGYFQLMQAVDEFVLYDNIEFTKKGWINRNRILVNGTDDFISFPLKKDSDYLHVRERRLADTWPQDSRKMLNRLTGSYKKAPYFNDVYPLLEAALGYDDLNLFQFIFNSLHLLKDYLQIDTRLNTSSTITIDHTLRAENKVIAICKALQANKYINPIGGVELYNKAIFMQEGIDLHFINMNPFVYKQFENEFVPALSIIDVMMFNSVETIQQHLQSGYTLI